MQSVSRSPLVAQATPQTRSIVRRHPMTRTGALVLVLLASLASAAGAQTGEPATRAEALRREREAKQKALEPHEPNALERGMYVAEDRVIPLLQRDGLYAKFGSLTTGSGTAFGIGVRDRSLVRGLGSLDVWAAGSFSRYWALEARGQYPLTEGGALSLDGAIRRFSYPSEEFFGIGPSSRGRRDTSYAFSGTTAVASLIARPNRRFSFSGGIGYLDPEIGRGRGTEPGDNDDLSIHDVFTDQSAPGLAVQSAFVKSSFSAAYDYRMPVNARRGGWYRFEATRYDDRSGGDQSFSSYTLDLRQFVSILAERRVFAGRIWVATTEPAGGSRVPFYLMPALGGNDSLRGFRHNRFRGPHALLLQGEYRWEIWSGLDAALFVDAGKVALRRADLDFDDLEHDYGFGFRFNTDNAIIFRVDAAFGSRDGKRLHVVFGGIF
jgi:outer membrane protein assembly factor BamA